MAKMDVARFIKLRHAVKDVRFNDEDKTFSVIVRDLNEDVTHAPETFDFVVNATGHFSFANIPKFEGIQTFPGRIIHSTDFR